MNNSQYLFTINRLRLISDHSIVPDSSLTKQMIQENFCTIKFFFHSLCSYANNVCMFSSKKQINKHEVRLFIAVIRFHATIGLKTYLHALSTTDSIEMKWGKSNARVTLQVLIHQHKHIPRLETGVVCRLRCKYSPDTSQQTEDPFLNRCHTTKQWQQTIAMTNDNRLVVLLLLLQWDEEETGRMRQDAIVAPP